MHSVGIELVAMLAIACLGWIGCGAPECKTEYSVMPTTASADHTAAFPANSVTFTPFRRVSGPCAQAAILPLGTWSTSDNVNAPIDANSGLATCLNATPIAATIRFTSTNASEVFPAASLTCR